MARYGEYPVNYYTGLPTIEIPLYTVSAGAVQVATLLNYGFSSYNSSSVPCLTEQLKTDLYVNGKDIERDLFSYSTPTGEIRLCCSLPLMAKTTFGSRG
ncbi:MAG: hypothetical protein U0Y10_17135 [Spirosomataceae bacterium]